MHDKRHQFHVCANSLPLEFFLIFLREIFLRVFDMMSGPPRPKEGDDTCPICNKAKGKHTNEEILSCSRKMIKVEKSKTDEAGME
jgi:hypothetical protein